MTATALVPSLISGDFFDEGKNTFSPVTKKNIAGVSILEARKAEGRGSSFKNAYNAMGESLYYMTPKSIFRTLFINGEGFARVLNHNNKMLRELSAMFGGLGVAGISVEDIISSLETEHGESLRMYLEVLTGQIDGGTLSARNKEIIRKLLKSSQRNRNLTYRHSVFLRFKAAYEEKIGKKLRDSTEFLRTKIVDYFRSRPRIAAWFARHGGDELLEIFAKSGGLKNLVQPVVTAILGIMGVTLTPIISIAVSAVSGAIITLALKGLKVLLQIGQIVLIAFVAVVVLGLGGARKIWRDFNKRTYSYNYVVPNTVATCDVYGQMYTGIIDNPNPGPGPYFPPYPGGDDVYEIFAQAREYVSSNYRPVSTGLELVTCPGHDMCSSIDWAWCYSAGSIFCKGDKLMGTSPQYAYELFVHELIHQIQGWGACNTDMREWGADYLSNNGGNYNFTTPSG
jgi:hypothetical protein